MKAELIYTDEQVIFIINDSAMLPQLMPGSLLAGHYIETYLWSRQKDGVFAIVLDEGMILIRRIKENQLQSKGLLTLYSDNNLFQPQTIMIDNIHSIYLITEILRQTVI